jgi:hypothetical protein
MPEFLHEVVKKREREMEYRTLMSPSFAVTSPSYGTTSYTFGRPSHLREGQFVVPTLTMPPINEIAYRSVTEIGITQHSIVFPNVGGWVQSAVMVNTPADVVVRSQQMLTLNAWELLAGHMCRPNYTWSNNAYTCRSCSARYETDGSEWQRTVHPTSEDLGAN